jgi:hypothetical protein
MDHVDFARVPMQDAREQERSILTRCASLPMNPIRLSLSDLLVHSEQDWLDWKSNFSDGLLGSSHHSNWERGRAKLLRALVSIANSVHDRCGYVVYGVDDSIAPRSVCGIGQRFDEALFQDWAHRAFRPRVDFGYKEQDFDSVRVGIFEIRPSSDWPHVCEQSIGEVLHQGQVWYRRGTRCIVAAGEELRRMFAPQTPIIVGASDGPLVSEIRELNKPHGWEPHWPLRTEQADYQAKGHRLARLPGSRQEIHYAGHVLMLRRTGAAPITLTDFYDSSRFERCGGSRTHSDRVLAVGRPCVSQVYRDRTTGQFYQLCADAREYRIGLGSEFADSPWLPLP